MPRCDRKKAGEFDILRCARELGHPGECSFVVDRLDAGKAVPLTARQRETARECFDEYAVDIRAGDKAVYAEHIDDMFGDFLSRIREKQEPAGYFIRHETGYFEVADKYKNDPDATPLFTIPPAAQDCKKLVEALDKINKIALLGSSVLAKDIHSISGEVLAKHKASMEGK